MNFDIFGEKGATRVILSMVLLTIGGFQASGFGLSLYIEPLKNALNLNSTRVSELWCLGALMAALIVPATGKFVDLVGCKTTVMLAGPLYTGFIATFGIVGTRSAVLVGIWFFGLRVFGTGVSMVVTAKLLNNWFDVKTKGRASLVVFSFYYVTSFFPPVIAVTIRGVGWEITPFIFAGGSGVLILLSVLLMQNKPDFEDYLAICHVVAPWECEDSPISRRMVQASELSLSRGQFIITAEGLFRPYGGNPLRTLIFWVIVLQGMIQEFLITGVTFFAVAVVESRFLIQVTIGSEEPRLANVFPLENLVSAFFISMAIAHYFALAAGAILIERCGISGRIFGLCGAMMSLAAGNLFFIAMPGYADRLGWTFLCIWGLLFGFSAGLYNQMSTIVFGDIFATKKQAWVFAISYSLKMLMNGLGPIFIGLVLDEIDLPFFDMTLGRFPHLRPQYSPLGNRNPEIYPQSAWELNLVFAISGFLSAIFVVLLTLNYYFGKWLDIDSCEHIRGYEVEIGTLDELTPLNTGFEYDPMAYNTL